MREFDQQNPVKNRFARGRIIHSYFGQRLAAESNEVAFPNACKEAWAMKKLRPVGPVAGKMALIVGDVVFAYLVVFEIPHPNFRGSLRFDEQLVPLLLVSVPMLFLGAWLLVSFRSGASKNEESIAL